MKQFNWVVTFAVGAIAAALLGWASWRSAGGMIVSAMLGAFLVGVFGEAWRWIRASRRGKTAAVCDYCGEHATRDNPVMLRDDINNLRLHDSCKAIVRSIPSPAEVMDDIRQGMATESATTPSKSL